MRHDLQRAKQRHAVVARPLQRHAQQQLESRGAGHGLGERQVLLVGTDRHVIADQRVDRAVGQRPAQGIAVALLPQRRRQPHRGVEVSDVSIGQVQGVDAHIRRNRQSFSLGRPHDGHSRSAGQPAQVHAGTGGAHQLEDRVQRHRLRGHRDSRQAQSRRHGPARGNALAQPAVLRTQPDGVAEGRGVLEGSLQHQGVRHGLLGLGETDAPRIGELGHLGQRLALQSPRQRTQREQPAAAELAGAELQHLDQAGLVQRRIGVRRAYQAGHAAGGSGLQLALEHAFVLEPGFAQPRGQVDEPGHDQAARGVDAAIGLETGRHRADGHDAAGGDGHVGPAVTGRGRVDDPAAANQDPRVTGHLTPRCPR